MPFSVVKVHAIFVSQAPAENKVFLFESIDELKTSANHASTSTKLIVSSTFLTTVAVKFIVDKQKEHPTFLNGAKVPVVKLSILQDLSFYSLSAK